MKEERAIELWYTAVAEDTAGLFSGMIMRFAELVAAETREECASVVRRNVGIGRDATRGRRGRDEPRVRRRR